MQTSMSEHVSQCIRCMMDDIDKCVLKACACDYAKNPAKHRHFTFLWPSRVNLLIGLKARAFCKVHHTGHQLSVCMYLKNAWTKILAEFPHPQEHWYLHHRYRLHGKVFTYFQGAWGWGIVYTLMPHKPSNEHIRSSLNQRPWHDHVLICRSAIHGITICRITMCWCNDSFCARYWCMDVRLLCGSYMGWESKC